MRACRYLLPFLLGLMIAGVAHAQQNVLPVGNPLAKTNGDTAVTITSTHGTVLAAGGHAFVDLANQSDETTGGTIYCRWGGTAAVASATAGQRTIVRLAEFIWDFSNTPTNGVLDCVCSVASCPATLNAY
jgi:hypothetical protein